MAYVDFDKSKEKVANIERSILIKLRNRPALEEQNESTSKINSEIRKMFQECEVELQKIKNDLTMSEKNSSAFSITQKEIERRRNIINELNNVYETNFKSFNESLIKPNQGKRENKINNNELLFGDSNYERQKKPDLINMNKTQLIELQKHTLTDQDQQIDDLTNTVNSIGKIGKTIGKELEIDIKLLGDLENGIDKNNSKMEKTTQNLSNFLKKTSNCCLLMIIAVELLIFILLLGIL